MSLDEPCVVMVAQERMLLAVAAPQHPARGSQPTLSDGVVWLTPWHDDDDVALGDFNLDPDHWRWFDQPPPDADRERRRVQHAEVIRRWRDEWASGASLTFALRTAEDGIAIGEADLQPRPPITANIAYAVTPRHRGRGYAPRAVRLLAQAGLTRFSFHRIELMCDVDNASSRRVAERAGFVYEGVRRGSGWFENVPEFAGLPRDDAVYSLTTSDLTLTTVGDACPGVRPRPQERVRSRMALLACASVRICTPNGCYPAGPSIRDPIDAMKRDSR